MAIEIEAKLKVQSFEGLHSRLTDLRAQPVGQVQQEDDYYDDPLRHLAGGDRCLRVRKESGSRGRRTVLCYKGPKHPARYKVRDELQVEVNDPQALGQILEALGYRRSITVRKQRQLWQVKDCLVSLDEVHGLGRFVEIEGPDEDAVGQAQIALGLEGLHHIPRSYASMLAEAAPQGRS